MFLFRFEGKGFEGKDLLWPNPSYISIVSKLYISINIPRLLKFRRYMHIYMYICNKVVKSCNKIFCDFTILLTTFKTGVGKQNVPNFRDFITQVISLLQGLYYNVCFFTEVFEFPQITVLRFYTGFSRSFSKLILNYRRWEDKPLKVSTLNMSTNFWKILFEMVNNNCR